MCRLTHMANVTGKSVKKCPFAKWFSVLPLQKKGMNYIHGSELYKLEGETFDIEYIKKDGVVRKVKNVLCTSFWSSGQTMNIKYPGYNHPVKIRRIQIIKINGKELIL